MTDVNDSKDTASGFRAMAVVLCYLFLGPVLTISLVYVPPMLRGLGLDGAQIGVTLGLQSAVSLVFPILWGYLADRTQRPLRILRLLICLAAIALLPLRSVSSPWALILSLTLFAVGNQAIVPLLDAIVMNGFPPRSFMRLRLFYIIGAFVGVNVYGRTLAKAASSERFAVLTIQLALVAALVISLFAAEPRVTNAARPKALEALSLLFKGGLLKWLIPFTVFRISMGPFDTLLALHMSDIGLPTHVAGDAYATALVAQVIFMLVANRFGWDVSADPTKTARWGLSIVTLSTALRWWLMASITNPIQIIGLQLVHALSGGATLVFTMSLIRELVPAHQRSTGQAALVVCIQVAMLIGQWGAGVVYGRWGAGAAFQIAAVCCVVATAILLVRRAPPRAAV